ncbi:MAG TPA: lipid-A-disaccharide synthase [Devosia sp.]|jgi:lipid-A-disaccharide synthase|uniref:lipid-A-disaccharide synthase n=1 Tax=Devosia sp. TaxID=1871048 RepID=UPI002DDD2532|nr:lipid-A-disaccharide synthase [Devosia sp.]HEV2514875.1 lipid-A-disaccharide synthase [Devosia sp.]
MAEPLRLFIVAGEASGDRIGADLVQRLRRQVPLTLSGVGGPELEVEGLSSLFPMANLSVMGWSDVLRRLPLLLWRLRQTANAIIRQRPDVVVLIDSQVFVKAVAARVRRAGVTVPMLLYVAPSIWAWRPERALELKPLFDEVLAVLPFEPKVMAELAGPPTTYVGHPALSRFPMRPAQPDRGPLLLLPGSRDGELRRHLPLMREAAKMLLRHPRVTGFVIPTLPSLAERLRSEVASWPMPVQIVSGGARNAAFASAYAAFAVSGTITFELAMSGVPMVVTYVADPHQARRAAKLGRPVQIALPNIILGREVVPELQFVDPKAERSLAPLAALLDESEAVAAQVAAFQELRALMQQGAPEAPLVDPAERVLALANQRLLIGS